MKLPENRALKVLIGFAGVILIGAIGSGVWELALRPLSTVLRDLVLNLISFGVQSFRDDVYSRIARGHDQSASVQLLFYFVMTLVSFLVFYNFDMFIKSKEMKQKRSETLGDIDEFVAEIESPQTERMEKTPTEIKEELLRLRQSLLRQSPKRFSLLLYLSIVVNLVFVLLLIFTAVSTAYVNSAVSQYEMLLAISTPYLDDAKRKLSVSHFAQIKSREDYVKITSELQTVITNQGIKPQDFSPW